MTETATLPQGEYAIVELFGHTTLVGRIAEVERFGAKMLAIEPVFRGALLGPVYHGGAAIYRLTPCTAEQAAARGPTAEYQLPLAIRAVLPAPMLEAARAEAEEARRAATSDPWDHDARTDPDDEEG